MALEDGLFLGMKKNLQEQNQLVVKAQWGLEPQLWHKGPRGEEEPSVCSLWVLPPPFSLLPGFCCCFFLSLLAAPPSDSVGVSGLLPLDQAVQRPWTLFCIQVCCVVPRLIVLLKLNRPLTIRS